MNKTMKSIQEAVKLPLWERCLENMRDVGISGGADGNLDYGRQYPTEYFEDRLRCGRETNEFAFAMLSLRQALENEDGYYLRSCENGKFWQIVTAPGHEDVAANLDSKMRRCIVRSINIRSATLLNPKAVLDAKQRELMEKNLEKAAMRLALVTKTITASRALLHEMPDFFNKEKGVKRLGETSAGAR